MDDTSVSVGTEQDPRVEHARASEIVDVGRASRDLVGPVRLKVLQIVEDLESHSDVPAEVVHGPRRLAVHTSRRSQSPMSR